VLLGDHRRPRPVAQDLQLLAGASSASRVASSSPAARALRSRSQAALVYAMNSAQPLGSFTAQASICLRSDGVDADFPEKASSSAGGCAASPPAAPRRGPPPSRTPSAPPSTPPPGLRLEAPGEQHAAVGRRRDVQRAALLLLRRGVRRRGELEDERPLQRLARAREGRGHHRDAGAGAAAQAQLLAVRGAQLVVDLQRDGPQRAPAPGEVVARRAQRLVREE
jgi:hypothetical protein